MTLPEHDQTVHPVDRYGDAVDALHSRATELRQALAIADAQWHRLESALAAPPPPRSLRLLALGDRAEQVLAVTAAALAAADALHPPSPPRLPARVDLRIRAGAQVASGRPTTTHVTATLADRQEVNRLRVAVLRRIAATVGPSSPPPPELQPSPQATREGDLQWAARLWERHSDAEVRGRLQELHDLHVAMRAGQHIIGRTELTFPVADMFRAIGGAAEMSGISTRPFPVMPTAEPDPHVVPALSVLLPVVLRFDVEIETPETTQLGTGIVLTVLTDATGATGRGRFLLETADTDADAFLLVHGAGGGTPSSWRAPRPAGGRQRPVLTVFDLTASDAFASVSGPPAAREVELDRLREVVREARPGLPDERVFVVTTRRGRTELPKQRDPDEPAPTAGTAFARRSLAALTDQAGFPALRRAIADEVEAFTAAERGTGQRDRYRRYVDTLQEVLQELVEENRQPDDVIDGQKGPISKALRDLIVHIDELRRSLTRLPDLERTVDTAAGEQVRIVTEVRAEAVRIVLEWPQWRQLLDAVEPVTGVIPRDRPAGPPLPNLTADFVAPFDRSAADMSERVGQLAERVVAAWIDEANSGIRSVAAVLDAELDTVGTTLIDRGQAAEVQAVRRACHFDWIGELGTDRSARPSAAGPAVELFPLAGNRALPWHPDLPMGSDPVRDAAQRHQITVMRIRRELTNALGRAGVEMLRAALTEWAKSIDDELRQLRGALPDEQVADFLEAGYGLRPARRHADAIEKLLSDARVSVVHE
ncbi:hypothetical protein [Dactylosporangium sp. NPDC000521]|uniref:hypothetical protein n=1 Tax=Dactylosporangium sp. NPDC000521 TaxID=3363975 RepID=UPI003692F772